jgi:hypothetical protein
VTAAARRFRRRGTGLALAVVLFTVTDSIAQRSAEEAIVPLAEYKAFESRTLAQAYSSELRLLYEAVRRCAPEVDFNRHGLGFRRPLGSDKVEPHLTIWVWLPREPAPTGADILARATDAFRRYGPRLLPHRIARSQIHSDARVGGYGLVLTWIKPPGGDPPIGETLVVFASKSAVEPFVGGATSIAALLAQARIRAFDGQTEVTSPRLEIGDDEIPAPSPSCSARPS